MKPIITQCVKERKAHIEQDVQLLLQAFEKWHKSLPVNHEVNSPLYTEAFGRLSVILKDLPDIIEAVEVAPELIELPIAFRLDYVRGYRKLIEMSSGKAYPLKSNLRRGKPTSTDKNRMCEGCVNSRCRRHADKGISNI